MTSACDNTRHLLGKSMNSDDTSFNEKVGDTMTSAQFEQLLELYGDAIFGFCCHLTGNRQSAEDLYQDAVLKAFSKLRTIKDGNFIKGRNFIIGVAVRLNKNRIRKKSFRNSFHSWDEEAMLSAADPFDIEAYEEKKELNNAVHDAVDRLPEKMRVIVYMYYFAEMNIRDIAKHLGISEGTAKSRLCRGRKLIKTELEGIYHE